MKFKFFSRRVRLFGNVAILILCAVLFLVPFGFRGARLAVEGMKNDVKDWLPSDFPETRELEWFKDHFLGEAFILITWENCSDEHRSYALMVDKLESETVPLKEPDLATLPAEERERYEARATGDKYNLHVVADEEYKFQFFENWGARGEKWLKGRGDKWYFITPDGELYEWHGSTDLLGLIRLGIHRVASGSRRADGTLIAKFGPDSTPTNPNPFHANPHLLNARYFKSVTTGSDVLEQLAGPGGSLRRAGSEDDDAASKAAHRLAYQRLTGVLFAPQPPYDFTWELKDFEQAIPQERQQELPRGWRDHYTEFVSKLIDEQYGGDRQTLVDAPEQTQTDHWRALFAYLGAKPPANFQWTLADFKKAVSEEKLRRLDTLWEEQFEQFIYELIATEYDGDEQALKRADEATQQAHWDALFERLDAEPTASYFWDVENFKDYAKKNSPSTLDQLKISWERRFESFIDEWVARHHEESRQALVEASLKEQEYQWRMLHRDLGVPLNLDPPPRQTAIIVTLSDVGTDDLKNVVGRPVMGRSPGRIQQLASLCNVQPDELKMGGPPIDNVAIDEEGTITLARLVTYSAIVGLTLAFLCFRSIKVTFMVFFVGGVSAATSLGIVWWSGSSVDAIVMSMPALVYVLGLSGAVHIVNYYRDAVDEHGLKGASETAIRHGWFPCTLAAFTTALGLLSLCVSNLTPIRKFGFFSAMGVLATLILLFTYLPAALHIWPPSYYKNRRKIRQPRWSLRKMITRVWEIIGGWVVRRHWLVTAGCLLLLVLMALGLPKINTSVQLLKLFDPNAKIIKDYEWLEREHGKLVPMELVVRVDKQLQRPPLDEIEEQKVDGASAARQLTFLERAELAARVQDGVEQTFGEEGQDIVGHGMSAVTFIPPLPSARGGQWLDDRSVFSSILQRSRNDLMKSDYLRIDEQNGRELWRVSLRLGALNDVDYGAFVGELKMVVEPILSAYRYRDKVFRTLYEQRGDADSRDVKILVLGGPAPKALYEADDTPDAESVVATADNGQLTQRERLAPSKNDQTRLFARTFNDLFLNRGFRVPTRSNPDPTKRIVWHVPESQPREKLFPDDEKWAAFLERFNCVVLLREHDDYDLAFIRQHVDKIIDARDHRFDPAAPTALTAAERRKNGDRDANIDVVYTGIVPIVYKSQRTLLSSLIESIGLSFVMIATVMMILLRDWRARPRLTNLLNPAAGLVSMLPNVFPLVVVFGIMGHIGRLVDIGSMMTASVAMGIAVDDTIHFLTWFRHGLRQGLDRRQAIALAYDRCASAMTQTTLIGGFGLAVFYLSTFTPTMTFGMLMLCLLCTALVGDLIFLPALLAGPLGRFFEVKAIPQEERSAIGDEEEGEESEVSAELEPQQAQTPHTSVKSNQETVGPYLRHDKGHRPFGK